MSIAITICFLVTGVINFIPLVGVLSKARLETLYGLSIESNELTILLKHRAVLFGIVGGFIIFSAFYPIYQPISFVLGYISMISFLIIALHEGNYNSDIRKVVIADVIGIISFLIATILYFFKS